MDSPRPVSRLWEERRPEYDAGKELVFVTVNLTDGRSPRLAERYTAHPDQPGELGALLGWLVALLGLSDRVKAAMAAVEHADLVGTAVITRQEDGTFRLLADDSYWIEVIS